VFRRGIEAGERLLDLFPLPVALIDDLIPALLYRGLHKLILALEFRATAFQLAASKTASPPELALVSKSSSALQFHLPRFEPIMRGTSRKYVDLFGYGSEVLRENNTEEAGRVAQRR
jgi:hypothetical protein